MRSGASINGTGHGGVGAGDRAGESANNGDAAGNAADLRSGAHSPPPAPPITAAGTTWELIDTAELEGMMRAARVGGWRDGEWGEGVGTWRVAREYGRKERGRGVGGFV